MHQVGFIYKITVGHLYQSFSGMFTQLRSKDLLTHNVDTVWLVQDCDCMELYIKIHSSLMYNGAKIIFSPPSIRTIIQLQVSEIQRLTVHDIHFAKQHHSSVTLTVATACTFTHSLQEDLPAM